ncbi:MAG: nicotinate-nucleotide adenylyltransferase [Synergistota bacterium]|nr:nicotinate-nucleotide adenylyltransferase [Synergistota bacterium]
MSNKNKNVPRNIGIMGGTFDPIHFGHLLAAEESRTMVGLDEVIFVPAGDPAHKRLRRVAPSESRFVMTLLATLGNPDFTPSRIEIDRHEPSHTVDTLREMQHWYSPDEVVFYFITGLDAVINITTWKEYAELPELCKIVAVNRPGYAKKELDALPQELKNAIIPLEIPLLSISSTEIRRRVEEGRSVKYLLPEAVEQYILKNGLYRKNSRRTGR